IDAEARDRIRAAIARARDRFDTVHEVAAPSDRGGYYVGPTVVTDVTVDDELAQQEIFGPVLAVMKAATFEDALTIANSTRYGLTGGVYSRHPAHLARAREAFDVGNLYLN